MSEKAIPDYSHYYFVRKRKDGSVYLDRLYKK